MRAAMRKAAVMKSLSLLAAAAAAVSPVTVPPPVPSPAEIVGSAPAAEWIRIAPADLVAMDLAPDARGRPRRVVIQLMPPPFSQGWIANIRKLAAARWWDGLSINRVQDNYVVQWGDAEGEDKAKAKKLPRGLRPVPQSAYVGPQPRKMVAAPDGKRADASQFPGQVLGQADAYARQTGIANGWPIAGDGTAMWPVHCYGTIGVGRDMPPDTGSGAELYAVIGHAPRHLDRNIAVVGRVIEGIEHLSSLPRGTGPLGFYASAEERVTITSIRIGTALKDLPAYEYLATGSPAFVRFAEARANRRDGFFVQPAGGADICNVPVPVRRVQ
jgi:peptidylprolyl isomerase